MSDEMQSAYRFPDQRELILRDAERVQKLDPKARLGALLAFLAEGEYLSHHSPNREVAARLRGQERLERRKAIRQLLARHGF
jgi:hypothetical protein